MGRSAVLMELSVLDSLAGEVAHLPFDHARVAAIPPLRDHLVSHFVKKEPIVIIMSSQGEKNPVSISWIG